MKISIIRSSGPGVAVGRSAPCVLLEQAPSSRRTRSAAPARRVGEQVGVIGVRDDDLHVGTPYVVGERLAAAGRVEPDDDLAAERGAAEQERELRHVVEQHADVRRLAVRQQRGEHRRPHARLVARPRPRSSPASSNSSPAEPSSARASSWSRTLGPGLISPVESARLPG